VPHHRYLQNHEHSPQTGGGIRPYGLQGVNPVATLGPCVCRASRGERWGC
jgi:hypothetical protein